MNSAYSAPLITMQSDGPALAASTTPTSLLLGAAKYSLQPGQLNGAGMTFRVTATGRVSNIVTSPGTLTLDIRFGSVVVANGGAMALNIIAKTNVTWSLSLLLTVRTIGDGTIGSVFFTGMWTSESIIGAPANGAGGMPSYMLPVSAPAVGTGFNSTIANVVDMFGTWSANSAGNSIQVHQYCFESLN